eukprot:SAG31_NODE_96_length_25743_cov_56.175948_10_plen_135_part_00
MGLPCPVGFTQHEHADCLRFDGIDGAESHRLTDLTLGGGATLDIGVYPLSCLLLAFGTAQPTSLAVAGTLTESGADKAVAVSAVYGDKQLASLTWTIEAQTPEEWKIIGSKGVSLTPFSQARADTECTTILDHQ